jgi:hypothetical protein
MSKHKYGAYAGYRFVDGQRIYFASRMEFNYYLYLQELKRLGIVKQFFYQPNAFDFKARAQSQQELWGKPTLPKAQKYQPDFLVVELQDGPKGKRKVPEITYYVEVVGMLRRDHTRKFKLIAQLFPEVTLKVVTKKDLENIRRGDVRVPDWETGKFTPQDEQTVHTAEGWLRE